MIQIEIRNLSAEEFGVHYSKYRDVLFQDDHSYTLWDLLNEDELANIRVLDLPFGAKTNIRLGAFNTVNNEFLGWSWGFQENGATFYMCNSAVLPQYRRQGVYLKLIEEFKNQVQKLGFQLLYSRHCATNNAVIIPKLKSGFIISKMEIDDKFGVLIHLHHYFNPVRRKIMDYRAGQISPDDQINQLFTKHSTQS